jgi:anti-sigma B factor antagonist
MKVEPQGDKVVVSEMTELGANNANLLRDQVRSALADGRNHVDIDLAETSYIDSCGLGALISIQKRAASLEGTVRLLRPQPPVRQLLQLTRMNQIFEIAEK